MFLTFFPPIVYFFSTGRSYSLYTIGVLFSILIGKPIPNHATIAWFYYTIKKCRNCTF